MTARRLVIAGRVQGVGYRDWLCAQAEAVGISGWVRNLPDGTVEALLDGEEEAVQHLLRACRLGPGAAVVSNITETVAEAPQLPGFHRNASRTES